MKIESENRRKIRVVVIDSGIDINKYNLKENVIESVGFRINKNGIIERRRNMDIENEHGTMIASCIKYICKDVELIDINILDENLLSNSKVLIKALKYAKSFKPHIINLSLGTTLKRYWIPLKITINSLVKENILIVASVDNCGVKTYPADYKNTIGVKGRNDSDINRIFYCNNYYYASGWENEVVYDYKKNNKCYGNSIATAYVTGYFCKVIKKLNFNIKKDTLKKIMGGYYYGNQ